MGPRTRRAMHQALDLILDAMAADALETPAPRARKRPNPPAPMPANVSDEVKRDISERLKKHGLPHLKAG